LAYELFKLAVCRYGRRTLCCEGLYVYALYIQEHTADCEAGDLRMKVIPVRLPDKIVETIDHLVKEGLFANRSAAIRIIVTNYALKEIERREENEQA
jgi:hypothetical protein